jgi:Domain of unknown function (DUF4351)
VSKIYNLSFLSLGGRQGCLLHKKRLVGTWMMTLPPDIEAEFKLEVKQLEAGRRMKYVTSFERSGIEIGRQEQTLLLVTRLLNRRLGNIDEDTKERVRSLSTEELERLAEELLDFTSVNDLTNWLSDG